MEFDRVLLSHGSGGRAGYELIKRFFMPRFNNNFINRLNDAAVLDFISYPSSKLAFTTDSYVVDPIFFPGGDIGRLAICGTINDISMMGAEPFYLSIGFIIEEGFLLIDLERILNSMESAIREASVMVVAADTKVVPKGCVDKIFINISGIGLINDNIDISGDNAKIGDKIIVSGTIGDHGVALLCKRAGLEFEFEIKTDCAPLNNLVKDMLSVSKDIHVLRDPTRGGLATTLNEISMQSGVGMMIYEDKIPIRDEIRSACEILGLDPLYIANEGKLVAFVHPRSVDKVLATMKRNIYVKDASIIGEVANVPGNKVLLKTIIGGTRILDMLTGEQIPRIC